MWLAAVVGTLVTVTLTVHWYLTRTGRYANKAIKNVRRVLIVVAHPDDECMFFGPTIVGLLRQRCDVHLLCLSSGNFYKEGMRRKVELRHSCQCLGIHVGNITVIEHTKLPDDPGLLWNKSVIRDIVLKYVETLGVDTVISFDAYGVSGHINHVAVFRALQHIYTKGMFPSGTQVFVLHSVHLLRKYAGLSDAPLSYYTATHCYVSGLADIVRAQRAMLHHRSQLVWYRLLYLFFSRYISVNTLSRIATEPKYAKLTRHSFNSSSGGSFDRKSSRKTTAPNNDISVDRPRPVSVDSPDEVSTAAL